MMRRCMSATGLWIWFLALSVCAAEPALQVAGVTGNAGEQGGSLIRQPASMAGQHAYDPIGCGLALDRQGTLWTRLVEDRVSRLALDGRLLAEFPAPPSNSKYDALVIVDEHVVLLAGGKLLSLALDAAPGTAFKPLGVTLRALARTSFKRRLAAVTPESRIVLVNPVDGTVEQVADIPGAWLVEDTPDGAILVGTAEDKDGKVCKLRKLVDGHEVTGTDWPRPFRRQYVVIPQVLAPAAFLQCDGAGGYFVGGASFVAHLDADLQPAPGTLLGKQNSYVIGGDGDWHYQLAAARGIVHCGADLYAVGGAWGQPFFARWSDPAQPMKLICWLAALPGCAALAINADGDMFVDRQIYRWDARPDSLPAQGDAGQFIKSQIVRVGPQTLARLDAWGRAGSSANTGALFLFSGDRLQRKETALWLSDEPAARTKDPWWKRTCASGAATEPAVAYPDGQGGLVLLCLVDVGGGMALRLNAEGRFVRLGDAVPFQMTAPGGKLTSLTMKDERTLFAAVDGHVVEMQRAGAGWKESRRWSSWGGGSDEHFGRSIMLAGEAGYLLVSDTERHRVLLFDTGSGKPRGQVGATDAAGTTLDALNGPRLVALCGNRAVVHDAGNQRLIKLNLTR